MGLLDDAIREHLDLKRRRGADPAEVERAEREALGPVRRNRDPAESVDSEQPMAAGVVPTAFDHEEHDAGWEEEEGYAPGLAAPRDEPVGPPVFDDEIVAESGSRAHYDDVEPAPYEPADHAAYEPEEDEYEPADHVPLESPAGEAPPTHEEGTWSAADEVEGIDEAFPTAPPPEPRRPDPVGDETREYRVEDALPHEHEDDVEGEGDDMLEETPEFLQDTPDHDRLWFEQRPPRDFDFDG